MSTEYHRRFVFFGFTIVQSIFPVSYHSLRLAGVPGVPVTGLAGGAAEPLPHLLKLHSQHDRHLHPPGVHREERPGETVLLQEAARR